MPRVMNCDKCGILFDSNTPKQFRVNNKGYDFCDECYNNFLKWLKEKPKKKTGESMVTKGYEDFVKPMDIPKGKSPFDLGLGKEESSKEKSPFDLGLGKEKPSFDLGLDHKPSIDFDLGFRKKKKKE